MDWGLALEPGPTSLPGLPALASSGWRDDPAGWARSHTAAGRWVNGACGAGPGAPDIVVHRGGSWGCPWEETCYIVRRVR
jgi:hypothetical protein